MTVNEPSIEDSVQILQGLAPKYEQYHGVKISEGILRQAVLLSERYITDRFLQMCISDSCGAAQGSPSDP